MQNLSQIRARNALSFATQPGINFRGAEGGEVIKKIPPTIMNYGLLAALAYSFTEREGWQHTFDAIARHLSTAEIAIVPTNVNDRQLLLEYLTSTKATSEVLKRATTETMAWLEYARRFVRGS